MNVLALHMVSQKCMRINTIRSTETRLIKSSAPWSPGCVSDGPCVLKFPRKVELQVPQRDLFHNTALIALISFPLPPAPYLQDKLQVSKSHLGDSPRIGDNFLILNVL